MTRELPTAKDDELHRRLNVIMLLDGAFAVLIQLRWSVLLGVMIAPLQWATQLPVSAADEAFDYPFVMLWGLPLVAVALGWMARKSGHSQPAIWIAAAPLLLFAAIAACYHFLPGARP